jgi:hypothetical protein
MQGLYLLLVLFLTAAIVGFIVGDHPGDVLYRLVQSTGSCCMSLYHFRQGVGRVVALLHGHDEHGLPVHFVGRCRYATLMLSSTSHLVLRGSVLGSVM